MDQLVVWAIVSPGGWPEPWGLGQRLGCFAGWGGGGGMGERGRGGGYSDGCRPRLGRAQCQGLSGTLSFLGACSAPSWGPSRVQGYMVSARQVHLPHYLCPTHASTLLSPAPSAPYGNDLLLPDLADTHGSPSAYATAASVCLLCSGLWMVEASLNLLSLCFSSRMHFDYLQLQENIN